MYPHLSSLSRTLALAAIVGALLCPSISAVDQSAADKSPAVQPPLSQLPAVAVELHPDGARLSWRVDLPAGTQTYELPPWAKDVTVIGATSWQVAALPVVAGTVPASAELLRVTRNSLQQRGAVLVAQQAALSAAERRLRELLPHATKAAEAAADLTAWQVALDALLHQQATNAEAAAVLATERDALRRSAGSQARALLIDTNGPLTAEDLQQRWLAEEPLTAIRPLVRLQLVCAQPSRVVITTTREDLWWRPSAVLRLSEKPQKTATLSRMADVIKPTGLALGTVAVRALGSSLNPPLDGPKVPSVIVQADEVGAALRRQLTTGQRSVAWGFSSSMTVAGGDGGRSFAASASEAAPTRVAPIEPPDSSLTDSSAVSAPVPEREHDQAQVSSYGEGVDLDLGRLELNAGSEGLSLTLDRSSVDVVTDEWAMFPEDGQVALRRVSVRLGTQPLLPGMLQVIAGAPPRRSHVPGMPGGSLLTICAAVDETICVTKTAPWAVDPATNTDRRRRIGTDHWLLNSASAPRTVVVYRTMPVSTSDELTVTRDEASTPQATVIAPGLLRWTVTLPPGAAQRVGLGWTMQASGSFRF